MWREKKQVSGRACKTRLQIILVALTALLFPLPAFPDTSVNVNLDNWIYPALERLASFGLTKSGLMTTRPLTRIEVAGLIDEATDSLEDEETEREIDGVTLHLLERAREEFRYELADLRIPEEFRARTNIKPIDEISVMYGFLDGAYPVYNNNGVEYGDNGNVFVKISGRGRLYGILSLYYQPILKYNENLDDEEEVELDLMKGYIKFNLGNIELEIGRDCLWWGPGHHGSLLMTNNAEPFDMVKISNPRSITLPWIFRYLGPFKATWFITELEKRREVAEPYLTGFRVNFKPLPVLEIGASRVVMTGGEGRPNLGFDDILEVIIGENISGVEEDTSNQIASVDFSLRLGFLRNTEIYGEFGGEDEAGGLPTKRGYLAGIYVPRLTRDGKVDLRVEYAYNHVDGSPKVWYTHSVYGTGYKYEDSIIGHHMGSDTEDIFIRATKYVTDDLKAGIDFDIEGRGKSESSSEDHYQFGIDLSYNMGDMIEIRVRYGFERVENHEFVDGEDESRHFVGTGVEIRF